MIKSSILFGCVILTIPFNFIVLLLYFPSLPAPVSAFLMLGSLIIMPEKIAFLFFLIVPIFGFLATTLYILKTSRSNYLLLSKILLPIILIMNFLWFIKLYELGFESQGKIYTMFTATVSVIGWIVIILAIFIDKRPSQVRKIRLNVFFWLWICWYSFPWMGEVL